MTQIRFYQIPFSHYCDKVRWSLDFHSLDYESINYARNGKGGLEALPRTLQKLVPIIEDRHDQPSTFVADSTPILLYIDEHYGSDDRALFPRHDPDEKDRIVKYCLKLDSHLGLYARRLAYLHIINEQPSTLSVLIDGNYGRTTFDDWKSHLFGVMAAMIVIGRFAIQRIQAENIWEKTIETLNSIEEDLRGKQYLFGERFTAADVTLTSLIRPLSLVPSIKDNYASVFAYCDRIRREHDPKPFQPSALQRSILQQRENKSAPSFAYMTRRCLFQFFRFLLWPLHLILSLRTDKPAAVQYPSDDINQRANNDNRVLKLNSIVNAGLFFMQSFYHYLFNVPRQLQLINEQAERTFAKKRL